jgi:hypothetical protein
LSPGLARPLCRRWWSRSVRDSARTKLAGRTASAHAAHKACTPPKIQLLDESGCRSYCLWAGGRAGLLQRSWAESRARTVI